MRESSLNLDKALVTGLLPVVGTNLAGLNSCKNARPFGVGMEYVPPFESYLDLIGEYPFPQLICSDLFQYVATPTGIYEVVNDALVLRKTQSASTHYDMADFKDTLVLAGNGHTLFRTPAGELITYDHVPEASACCSFDGLLLLGNISSWDQSADVGSSTVAWAARPLSAAFQLEASNVATGAGYIKLFCGDILRIFKAEKKIVVFGTKGIDILNLSTDPIPTLAVEREIACTISGKEAIVQTNEGFVFTDAFGFAFGFDLRETKRLGFKRFFAGSRVVGTFDPSEQEVLLSNGVHTITIGQYGAGSRAQAITSGGLVAGAFKAVVTDTESYDMELVVDTQDMGVSGLKTVYEQPIGCYTDGIVKANGANVGPLTVGTKIITQDSFQPTVSILGLTQAQITALELRWKLVDKRYVRGQYDNQTTA